MRMPEVEDFVRHYVEHDGHIQDEKYVSGTMIRDKWAPLTWALDAYRRIKPKLSPRGCVCGKHMALVMDTKDYWVWACEPTGCGRLYVEAKGEGHATWYYAEKIVRSGGENIT